MLVEPIFIVGFGGFLISNRSLFLYPHSLLYVIDEVLLFQKLIMDLEIRRWRNKLTLKSGSLTSDHSLPIYLISLRQSLSCDFTPTQPFIYLGTIRVSIILLVWCWQEWNVNKRYCDPITLHRNDSLSRLPRGHKHPFYCVMNMIKKSVSWPVVFTLLDSEFRQFELNAT